jgi:hypothetical protein
LHHHHHHQQQQQQQQMLLLELSRSRLKRFFPYLMVLMHSI